MTSLKSLVLAHIQVHNPLYQEVIKAFEPKVNYMCTHEALLQLEEEKLVQIERTKQGYRYSVVEKEDHSETEFW